MKIPLLGDVIVVLLYLLPGFVAMQLYRACYPAKRQSQFEIIVWSLLHSFIIRLGIEGAASGLGYSDLDLLTPATGSAIRASMIAIPLVGGLAWGGVLIASFGIRFHIPFLRNPDLQAVWPAIADSAPKENLWVLVRTEQGFRYLGWVTRYSFDPEAEDHDFHLRPAYLVDDDLLIQRDLTQGGVYLNTRDVESLEMIPGKQREDDLARSQKPRSR